MDPNVLSTSVRYSNLPESSVRPESHRPHQPEFSACDDVRKWGDSLGLSASSNPPESSVRPESQLPRLCEDVRKWGDYLGLSTSSNPPDFNNAISEVSARECVPFFGLKQLGEASKAEDFHLVSNSGVPPEEVKEEVVLKKASEFGPPVEEKLDSDDPSNAVTLSTSFNANQETIHKNVTEGLISPALESSGKGEQEASDEGGPFQVPASDCKSNLDSTGLDKMRINFQIPDDVDLGVPNYVGNACSVNEGEIVLYRAFFEAGLRLPFHPFIGELLRRLGLAPGQLTPNAWRIIVCWLNLWQSGEDSAELSVDKFLYLYQLRKAPSSSSHWCLFPRPNDTKLRIKLPKSNRHWKSNYLVVRGEALLEGVNWSWGDPNKFDRPNLDDFHLNSVKKAVGNHNSLVTPQNLVPLSGDAEKSNQKGMNTKIQSQKKAKLPILGKRKASSELPSQESSAHGVIPPVIGPTTSSVDAILPLPVDDGPTHPSKAKEVAITPTNDTDGAFRNEPTPFGGWQEDPPYAFGDE